MLAADIHIVSNYIPDVIKVHLVQIQIFCEDDQPSLWVFFKNWHNLFATATNKALHGHPKLRPNQSELNCFLHTFSRD